MGLLNLHASVKNIPTTILFSLERFCYSLYTENRPHTELLYRVV
ncbi:hypothetical protein [Peribacillus frigoritolerans]|nr:hypothetical protein [Peribacillus frigoritolerans]